ncbi:MAG: MBL fold metallo-hydrolase, partial [Oricola sp.]|nr:MBL fold metallo-hydrolase [Oricola sp.]
KTVFLTHLHFDHAHNIDLFPEARFIVSSREWDYAANPHPKDILMPWRIHEQLEQANLDLIDGEGEIEPGLSYFPAPGHTPGCYALTFVEPGGKRVVVAGDAIKYVKEAILARCDMAFDTIEAGTASIQRILAMADRIVPGHFPELVKQENGAFSWDSEASLDLVIR